jgi:hypothetical protein
LEAAPSAKGNSVLGPGEIYRWSNAAYPVLKYAFESVIVSNGACRGTHAGKHDDIQLSNGQFHWL